MNSTKSDASPHTATPVPEAAHLVDHPLILDRLTRVRDTTTSPEEFRRSVHEITQLMAFEVTRDFRTSPRKVSTPLDSATGGEIAVPIVLVPILRAGLGMLNGFLHILREARVGHIGMFRNETTLLPENYYCNLPDDLDQAEVLLIDPMLATGNSSSEAVKRLKENGARRIRFVCLVSCPEGITHFHAENPDVPIYTAAIDRGLNEIGYIVPGLGDAGDRYFGTL